MDSPQTASESSVNSLLRQIPSVEELLNRQSLRDLERRVGHRLVVEATRQVLQRVREGISAGTASTVSIESLEQGIQEETDSLSGFSLQPVINATGVILQTASTNGVMGYPFYADYNATKAGVIELTRSMALELAPRIRVCAVAPGYVLTPMQRAEYTDEMLDQVNAKIPLRRHAKPEEIAALFA